jgi:hypothetical protein
MAYPKQSSTQARLETLIRKDMRIMERRTLKKIFKLWKLYKNYIKQSIYLSYRSVVPHGEWNLVVAKNSNVMHQIGFNVRKLMNEFRHEAKHILKQEFKKHYLEEYLRNAWLMDMITPKHIKINLTPKVNTIESVRIYTGRNALVKWFERFEQWTLSWEDTVRANIMLNAMHEKTVEDTTATIDSTRVSGFDLWGVFNRLVFTELLSVQAEARQDFANANQNIILEEIWQTAEDERTCPECSDNDQKTRDEVNEDDNIPLHPACRCFWRTVPKTFADLAKSDPALARQLDTQRVVPDSMAILNDKGQLTAMATISFNKWQKDSLKGISVD